MDYQKYYISHHRLPLFLVFIYVLQLVACPLWGQVQQKKKLEVSDYHMWSFLNMDNISHDEQWASYKVSYLNKPDTLFVQNIHSKKKFAFTEIESSFFTKNNFFIASSGKELYLLNLKTEKREYIKNVKQYSYSQNSDLIILLFWFEAQKEFLQIRTLSGKIIKEIPEITQFSLSPNGQELLYSSKILNKHTISLINLKQNRNEKTVILNSEDQFDGFTWQKQGYSCAFFSKADHKTIKSIFYFVLKKNKLYALNPDSNIEFPKDSLKIDPRQEILISDDSERVFFNVRNKNTIVKDQSSSDVEIWNGNDKWIYVNEMKQGNFEKSIKSALWKPETNSFKLLTTDNLPKIALTGNKDFAILSNPKDYEPQKELDSPRDYYLLNLQTFEKSLLIKKLPYEKRHINPSPAGNYIAYFKNESWWVYSIKYNKHTNITCNIPVKFTAKEESFKPKSPCGNPGWTKNDKEILLYDQYDIWAVTPDGKNFRRLTNGRKSKIRYRIADIPNKFYYATNYEDNRIESYDNDLFLRAEGEDGKTGYFSLNGNYKLQEIVFHDSYIDQFFYGSKKQNFFFREQKFDLSPQLVAAVKLSKLVSFFQSNPQQKNYFWGKTELISYQNQNGKELKGALIYPANYDAKKKYPMIVNIYELKSREIHLYKNPSIYNDDGFNKTNFSLQGYFILLPDIIQEYQNAGGAVVDCLTAAVNKVLEKDIIDPERLGLIGFSSGGYEAAFAVTQNNLFAAAVAGSAVTDLHSLYFSLGQGPRKPEMWRFQSSYWMIEKSPFQAPELYNKSSPLFHSEKVNTPLLLWTGKLDRQVDPHQSMEFYLALRSLEKKIIMLQYPAEIHGLSNPINQTDLTNRVQNWFDYFLKDIHSTWVESGTKQ